MSKEILVIALGVWITFVPYLGVPGSWRTVILILTGLALILIGFFLRGEVLSRGTKHDEHQLFVENSHEAETHPHRHERTERITSLN